MKVGPSAQNLVLSGTEKLLDAIFKYIALAINTADSESERNVS